MIDENQSKNFFDDDDIFEEPNKLIVSEIKNNFKHHLTDLVKYIISKTWHECHSNAPTNRVSVRREDHLLFPIYGQDYIGADLRVLYLSLCPAMFTQPDYRVDVICDYIEEKHQLKITLSWITHTVNDDWYANIKITGPGEVSGVNKFHSLYSQIHNSEVNYSYKFFNYTDVFLQKIVTSVMDQLSKDANIYLTSSDIEIEFLLNGNHFFTYNKFLNSYWKYIINVTARIMKNEHRVNEIILNSDYFQHAMPDLHQVNDYIMSASQDPQFRKTYKTLNDLHVLHIGFVSGMSTTLSDDVFTMQLQLDALKVITNKYFNRIKILYENQIHKREFL